MSEHMDDEYHKRALERRRTMPVWIAHSKEEFEKIKAELNRETSTKEQRKAKRKKSRR